MPDLPVRPGAGAQPRVRFGRASGGAALGTALSRVTGVVRTLSVVGALGLTELRLADVYAVANITPNILYELLLGGILTSVFVPLFVDLARARGEDEAWEGASAVAGCALLALVSLAVAGVLLAPWIYRLYSIGDPADAAAQAAGTALVRWVMPQVVFYGTAALAGGLLNAHDRFAVSSFAPVASNLAVSAVFASYYLLFTSADVEAVSGAALAWIGAGTTLGVLLQAVAHLPSLHRVSRGRLRPRVRFRDPAVARLVRLSGGVLGYVAVNQAGYLVVTNFAYAACQGCKAAYDTAFVFFQLPHGLIAVSISTVLLPRLARAAADGDERTFRHRLRHGTRLTLTGMLPAAAGLALLAPAVSEIALVGTGSAASAELLGEILALFCLGLVPFSLYQLLIRGFYARQDTRSPLLVNVAAVAVNVAADVALYPSLGVHGLAIGYAAAYLCACALALVVMRRRVGGLDLAALGPPLFRIAAATAVMAAAVLAIALPTRDWAGFGPRLGRVLLEAGAGLLLYGLVAWRLGLLHLDVDDTPV